MKIIYLELLKDNCSKDPLRKNIQKPLNCGDYVAATDGVAALFVPKLAVNGDFGEPVDSVLNILRPISDLSDNGAEKIPLHNLEKVMKKIPKILEVTVKDCNTCEGFGAVEWEFEGHTKDGDCPVCDGEGGSSSVNPDKQVLDDEYTVFYKSFYFSIEYFDLIIKIASELKENHISMKISDDGLIVFIDEAKFFIMPRNRYGISEGKVIYLEELT